MKLKLKKFRMPRRVRVFAGKVKRQWKRLPWHRLAWMKRLNPFRHVKRMDWYIIKKFIGTYLYSILLIISISIVFDVN